ncbi:MAG TPA: hypothetical protein VHP83_17425 [Aggregatilineaceae bacterium]|nr:hypothetical protein [Aggregatilineaceae bacterium]
MIAIPQPVQTIASYFAALPEVAAVVLGGSLTTQAADSFSDFDIYIYSHQALPPAIRASLAAQLADPAHPVEINNPYWGSEDAWIEKQSGIKADLVYWSPTWIEEQLNQVLVNHQASTGYSTCFWYTILHSTPVFDRTGWFRQLHQQANQPYPDALRRAIIRQNYPVLRHAIPAYRSQIALAIARQDFISLNHRIAALLASYFDVLFAVNRVPHPGEKRLIQRAHQLCTRLPHALDDQIDAVLRSDPQTTLMHLDALLDSFDQFLRAEGLI